MSAYHCDKLCSEPCCALLRWALTDPDPLNNAELERHTIFEVSGVPDFMSCVATHKQKAAAAVHDPAKLTKLGAMALLARGIPSDTDFPATSLIEDPPTWVIRANEDTIDIVRNDDITTMSLPEFRTLVARIMATPPDESSREQVEKMVRGVT